MTFDSVIAGSPRSRSPRRGWDVALTVVLLVLLVPLTALGVFAGAFLVMASDSCGSSVACRTDQLSAGVVIAVLGPAAVTVVTIASMVERLVRARLAFWAPIVGIVVAALVWSGGVALVFASVPTS